MKIEEILNRTSRTKTVSVEVPRDIIFEANALELSYLFLGHRNYAHGSSMLEGMLHCAKLFYPTINDNSIKIRQFKVIKQFATLSRAETMRYEDVLRHPRLRQAAARLDLEVGKERLTSLLFPTHSPIPGRLSEYNAGDYVGELEKEQNGKSFGSLVKIKDYVDLIRGINECNRQSTVLSFPNPEWSKRVRWAFICNIPILSAQDCARVTRVSFEPKDVVDIGHHRFEIKIGRFEELGSESDFEICFFIELPRDGDKKQQGQVL
jgi:hypothetical protein